MDDLAPVLQEARCDVKFSRAIPEEKPCGDILTHDTGAVGEIGACLRGCHLLQAKFPALSRGGADREGCSPRRKDASDLLDS